MSGFASKLKGRFTDRVSHFKGSPREIGFASGRAIGSRLEAVIDCYISGQADSKDMLKNRSGALEWLRSLPQRYQDEFEGLAEGSGVTLQRLAEFAYIEECDLKQCSGAVYRYQDRTWVARNNDFYIPELWGYASIREVDGRIPTISFSTEAGVFTPTGINQEKLWLHYNFLPVWDQPSPGKPCLPPYVFLTEALECCRTIGDVEALLEGTDRSGGMLLFAVDGKSNAFALFDCQCSQHQRREVTGDWVVGTNHYCTCEDPTLTGADRELLGTVSRFQRLETLMQTIATAQVPNLPGDLIRMLADDQVERRQGPVFTVYSAVACPASGELWHTFGGCPAASQGNWQRLAWPW